MKAVVAVNVIDDKTYELILDETELCRPGRFLRRAFHAGASLRGRFQRYRVKFAEYLPRYQWRPLHARRNCADSFQRYRANPDYYEGPPGVAILINHALENNELMLLAVEAGEVDYANMQGDIFQQLSQNTRDNLQVQFFPANSLASWHSIGGIRRIPVGL